MIYRKIFIIIKIISGKKILTPSNIFKRLKNARLRSVYLKELCKKKKSVFHRIRFYDRFEMR